MYDVAIIGAGPSGTAAAFALAAAGHRVLILDRRNFPRKKACAGGVTPKAMALFPYDISHLVLRTCRQVKLIRPGGTTLTIQDKDPLCYMVQRKDLDQFSLTRAMAAGAEFKVVDKVIALADTPGKDGIVLTLRENAGVRGITARFILGADGANSRVRSLLAGQNRFSVNACARVLKYPALEADVRVPDPKAYPMVFDFSKGIQGYHWIFPKDDHVNIGIYGADPGVSLHREQLESYARTHLGTHRLEAVKGYPIGVGARAFRGMSAGQGRVLLAGDAAGLAEPLLGEGIYMALKSGQLAAAAIHAALGAKSLDGFALYHASLSRLRLDLWYYYWAARLLYRFPRGCLALTKIPYVLRPFSRGYASGKALSRIILPF